MMRSYFSIVALALLALAAGCTRSPQVRFYELVPAAAVGASASQTAAPTPAGQPVAPGATTVSIGPVTLPEVVDRPQLVVQDGPNRVRILETKRWAESLKSSIPRYLAHDMEGRLAPARVFSYLQMSGVAADYRVVVDVRRFEAAPADQVTVEADWLIRHAGKTVKTGHSTFQQKIGGAGYDAMVTAYGGALSALGGDLAAAVSELQAQKR